MAFTVPSYQAIREAILTAQLGLQPDIEANRDSDNYIRASGFASATEGLYQHQLWIVRQIFADTADEDSLEAHARVRGISRKPAVPASGSVRVKGAAGTYLPIGMVLKTAEGISYATTEAVTIGDSGEVLVAATATVAGAESNLSAVTTAELEDAPLGVDAELSIESMIGGADVEGKAALLERYLDVIRQPSAGGNRFDFRRWAMEVPGVVEAFVYDLRRGLGTVDVAILATDGVPSQTLVDRVTAHIEEVRPVGMRGWMVLAPTPVVVDVVAEVGLTGTRSLAQVKDDFTTEALAYFYAQAPGTPVLKSKLETMLSEVQGVRDRVLSTPSGNISPVVNSQVIEWCTLGTVTFTQMAGV